MYRKDPFSYSGFTKNIVNVPAFGIATVEYADVTPNYFRVQNMGSSVILGATSVMPSKNRYDFAISGETVKMYAEPNKRPRLYLLNQSGTDIECVVVAFEAPFDPMILALSEVSFSLDTSTLSISQEISGFNASLPAGTNNIGSVNIGSSLPSGTNNIGSVNIGSSLPSGTNNIGSVNIVGEVITLLREISGKLTDAEGVSY